MANGTERAQRSAIKRQGKSTGWTQEFIIKGIEAGKLEFRYSSVWGSPFIKVLRRQLEEYIAAEKGQEYLARAKGKTELKKIKKEIAEIEQRLRELQTRKDYLEKILDK